MQRYANRPASAGPAEAVGPESCDDVEEAGAHRMRFGIRARIIMALHRHGIYW